MPLGEVAAVEREVETLLGLEEAALCATLFGDVVADAAVAGELAVGVHARLAGDDVDLPRAALVDAGDLDARDLPEAAAVGLGAAEEQRHRPAAREPGNAVLAVGFPEPVGGELGQA